MITTYDALYDILRKEHPYFIDEVDCLILFDVISRSMHCRTLELPFFNKHAPNTTPNYTNILNLIHDNEELIRFYFL